MVREDSTLLRLHSEIVQSTQRVASDDSSLFFANTKNVYKKDVFEMGTVFSLSPYLKRSR